MDGMIPEPSHKVYFYLFDEHFAFWNFRTFVKVIVVTKWLVACRYGPRYIHHVVPSTTENWKLSVSIIGMNKTFTLFKFFTWNWLCDHTHTGSIIDCNSPCDRPRRCHELGRPWSSQRGVRQELCHRTKRKSRTDDQFGNGVLPT